MCLSSGGEIRGCLCLLGDVVWIVFEVGEFVFEGWGWKGGKVGGFFFVLLCGFDGEEFGWMGVCDVGVVCDVDACVS